MRYNKQKIKDLELWNKRVVVRLDLNVPIDWKSERILNRTRILGAFETLDYLLNHHCKIVVLSHFSRIKSFEDISSGKKSLRLVARELSKMFSTKKVVFIDKLDFSEVKNEIQKANADIVVLENTRYYDIDLKTKELVKWESKNFPVLAQFYAELGEIFINDAFGTSHRAHASNVGIAERTEKTAIGFLVEKELGALDFIFDSTDKPKVMVLGGSKVSDKLKLIKEIINNVDKLLIGGGMSYTFLKAKGKSIGESLVELDFVPQCKAILEQYSSKIVLPIDHVVVEKFEDKPGKVIDAEANWDKGMALDIGPRTVKLFSSVLEDAKIVTWNGPLGVFEFENFAAGTFEVLKKLAEVTAKKGVYSLIGGGDSVAAVEKLGLGESFSFVSTGGGATLTFLEKGSMPGIEVIRDSKV